MLTPQVVIPASSPLANDGYPYATATDPVENAGLRQYELTNHLGNVVAVISDNHVANDGIPGGYQPIELYGREYFAFGGVMRSSNIAGSGYRYGFNGKENDDEVRGANDEIDYGMRGYDPRIGRFMSVDPISNKYPELTPYQYASSSPVSLVDIDGLEGGLYFGGMNESDAEKAAPNIAQADQDVVNFFVRKHQQGMNNVRIAESARITAINQGRADGDGITWYTKALVYLGPWWNSAAPLSHANDGSVLMTGKNLDHSDANALDYTAAGIGMFLPVAGGELKKGGSALIEGIVKVFKNGKEIEEAAYKIGKYGYKGTKEYNSIVKAVRSGGNIVANTKEEALNFLKEALPGIADETGKAGASKFGYRIDSFVDKGNEGLKQGHQGLHINYYDKNDGVYGTILIDEAPSQK
ncbi:MAG: RHS repeat-associated core domain-containing protein [Bacteroidota bacterium]|nr:RHS repeat-associated core domain-containing protein [Bacteroidota bacterium]